MASTSIGGKRRQSTWALMMEYPGQRTNSTTSAIKNEEKQHIKTRALEAGVTEPTPVLALQNALMIARIMRIEFPHDWYVLDLELVFGS
jgi:hypothetical protein